MNRLALMLLLLLPLSAHAASLSSDALDGQVLEEGTNKPIAGAIVAVRWQGNAGGPVDSSTLCYHVETATTDEQGRFHINAWKTTEAALGLHPSWFDRLFFGPTIHDRYVQKTAYKPGYTFSTTPSEKDTVWLRAFTGTQGERLRVTAGAAVTCSSRPEIEKNLLPLYHQLYEEARPLAVTQDEKAIVSNLLFKIESIELPFAEADKRNSERLNAIIHEK